VPEFSFRTVIGRFYSSNHTTAEPGHESERNNTWSEYKTVGKRVYASMYNVNVTGFDTSRT
jgi:hypothetical protein